MLKSVFIKTLQLQQAKNNFADWSLASRKKKQILPRKFRLISLMKHPLLKVVYREKPQQTTQRRPSQAILRNVSLNLNPKY
ncbi:MAG: hypothetical protein M1167_04360 [Chloroflexi bacterium]|nr:hypothetical protein [Chloroflexota bacterium]